MKQSLAFCAILAVLAQAPSADTKSDLLALTGGAQVRSVWLVYPWADSSYTPIQSRQDACSEGCRWTQIRVYDTDDGLYRWIDSTVDFHNHPLLTQKDASQVIYENGPMSSASCWAGSSIMIRDFKGTQPARTLIKAGPQSKYEGVLACSWNPVTDSEYVYVMGKGSQLTYRIPLIKPGYTADTAHAYTLPINNGGIKMGWTVTGSTDNQYASVEFPAHVTMFANTKTGTLHSRHLSADAFGCNANMAPDNSYRFFYLNDTHAKFRMYGPYAEKDSTQWDVDVVSKLPLKPLLASQDNGYPRWSNNVRYFSCTPPVLAGQIISSETTRFGWTATQVRALAPNNARHMVLGKFGADFKTLDGMALIAGNDVRQENIYGRVWVAGGTAETNRNSISRAPDLASPLVVVTGTVARATFTGAGVVSFINTSGEIVAQASGRGTAVCALGNQPAGAYVARVATALGVSSARIVVTR